MAAFFTTLVEVHDLEPYTAYSKQVPDIIKKYGGIVRVRGGTRICFEGDEVPERIVLVEFESLARGQACYGSPEYLEAAELAEGHADFVSFAVEGEALSDLDGEPGYFIARMNMLDLKKYEAYSAKAAPQLADWDAGFITAGPLIDIMGTSGYERCVLIRFPSLEQARGFHDSAEYKAVAPMREEAVEMQQFAVAGVR